MFRTWHVGIVTVTMGLIGAAAPAAAQSVVGGVVSDARTAQPLPGVTVRVENQTESAVTDAGGRFRLELDRGQHTLVVAHVGYASFRKTVDVSSDHVEITIALAEGAGPYEETVTVTGRDREAPTAPAEAALYGRELQMLKGVTLDDPLRAVQTLPSVTATDDFYSEFAVRGNSFRNIGLTVDGVPSRYLMHSVHGVTDGGSIAMINSETLGAVRLAPGSYPQKTGRRLGAEVDLVTREGSRDEIRGRAGLSGTSATILAEGPLQGGRGSWIVSARKSYLDLLLKQIDDEGSFAFGFVDTQARLTYDLSPRHQLQALTIVGRSRFNEDPQSLGANDIATTEAWSWLSTVGWRFMPSARLSITQRGFMTGLDYDNRNRAGAPLDRARSVDAGWRTDGVWAPASGGALVEFGGDALRLAGRHRRERTTDGDAQPSLINEFDARSHAASAYAQITIPVGASFSLRPGGRVDRWASVRTTSGSPWLLAEWRPSAATKVFAGAGIYRQFPELDQLFDVNGQEQLRPESAVHVDVGVSHALPHAVTMQLVVYGRRERDVLWIPGAEPRRVASGDVQLGRGDARWANDLDGEARGVEIVVRRDAATGLSGWMGYAWSRLDYESASSGETFRADADQRHTLTLYGQYRLSSRTTIGAKFRYGTNYPLQGYLGRESSPGAPPLFNGERPLFYALTDERNRLNLPAYARLDVRAERLLVVGRRRVTAFAEVVNALDRANARNVPYDVDRRGRVFNPTETLLPLVPSAGIIVEF